MDRRHPDEGEEWLSGRVESWIETYKKAMFTPVILRLVAIHQPVTIAVLLEQLTICTGWQITERGLYRSVKRLLDSGFMTSKEVNAPRTGAKRKELSLSALGVTFLESINANLVDLPSHNS